MLKSPMKLKHHAYDWRNFIRGRYLFSVLFITSKIISYPSTTTYIPPTLLPYGEGIKLLTI